MADTVRVKIDKKLKEVLEKTQKEIALEIKKKYNLDKITIYGNVASRFIAHALNGKKAISFNIKKTSLTEGILEID